VVGSLLPMESPTLHQRKEWGMSMKIISSGLEQYPYTRRSVSGRMVWGLRAMRGVVGEMFALYVGSLMEGL
jgi:hypothetical protein